jgi:hypothetical protein
MFHIRPGDLFNPLAEFHLVATSSGTRGQSAVVPLDLRNLRERAASIGVALQARGGAGWTHAIWVVPGGSAMGLLLQYGVLGMRTARWYSQIDPRDAALHPRYAWSSRVLRWGGLLGGSRMPPPYYAPVDQPLSIVNWMQDTRRGQETPHLLTFPTSAVRLCQFAREAGFDLEGTEFSIGGEPVTAARLETIRRAGAHAAPHYGAAESGPIGEACLAPELPDEVHLFDDLLALIQAGPGASLPSSALLVSTLRATCPLVLLNVSLGDEAAVRSRRCGCPMEQAGWTTHLDSIRSYEKLTAAGMTFVDRNLVRVLEDVLPARFGGSPADYQLLEEEDNAGYSRLKLLVHPALAGIDADAVASAFLTEISAGAGAENVMALVWRNADLLRVVRAKPMVTSTGKILHLHVARGAVQ